MGAAVPRKLHSATPDPDRVAPNSRARYNANRMDLNSKVAIVTGAGRGFGRAIALALGRAGCELAVAARSADQLVAVAKLVQGEGRHAIAVATDVADESAVTVLFDRTRAVFGRIDILVNAASPSVREAFMSTSPQQWRDLVATNLTGAYLCTHAVVPIMQAQGGGAIVQVAGSRALHAGGDMSATAAAQAGVLGLVRSLAIELEPAGIRVNAICPRDDADADEVAAAAVYVAGASSITGQTIEIA